nr:hypothetical protein Iba_chr12aCG4330 [Ipomoea batatas]
MSAICLDSHTALTQRANVAYLANRPFLSLQSFTHLSFYILLFLFFFYDFRCGIQTYTIIRFFPFLICKIFPLCTSILYAHAYHCYHLPNPISIFPFLFSSGSQKLTAGHRPTDYSGRKATKIRSI